MPGIALAGRGFGGGGGSPASDMGYGGAKERIGLETGAALKSLREQMAYRGLSGGGGERRGVRDVIMAGQGELGDVNRDIADRTEQRQFQEKEAQRNRDFAGAQAGLQAAMSIEDKPNMYGMMGNQRQQAIDQAMEAIRSLTGYSMGGASVSRGGSF